MNEGVQGLFSGIGNAMAETGQQGVNDYFQKSRLKLRQKLNAESAEKDREFQKEQAKTQDQRERERLRLRAKLNKEGQQSNWEDVTDEQGNIVGQRNTETNKFQPIQRSEGSADMDPYTEYTGKTLMKELDHLNKLERQVQGGNEQGILPGDTDHRKKALQDIKERKEKVQEKMQLLSGPPTEAQIIAEAGRIPEEDRDEFLNDVRSNPNSDDEIVKKIQRYWSLDDETQQPFPEPEPQGGQGQNEPRQDENNQTQQQEQPQPTDGQAGSWLLQQFLQGQNDTQVPFRSGQQGSQAQSQTEQEQPDSAESSRRRGRGIGGNESGAGSAINETVGDSIKYVAGYGDRARQAQRKNSIKNLEQAAENGPPDMPIKRAALLKEDMQYINEVAPEIQRKLIELFGEEAVKPYLNQE